AEQKGTTRLRGGEWLTDLMKQRHERSRPQLVAAIAECAVGRQPDGGIRPEKAPATRQFGQYGADRQRGVQMQRNDEPDHHGHGQLALARFAGRFLGQDACDRVGRDRPTQGFDSQSTAELAFGVNLAYLETLGVAPWLAFNGG